MKNNILVLGGAGFIGSNVCGYLLNNKDNFVICVDNLYTGDIKNISNYISNPRFLFMKHDITEPFEIPVPVNKIYNFACPASPKHYQKDPIFTAKTNFIGTLNMLEIAKKYHAIFLQASTSEIYGNPLEHPQKENYLGNVNSVGPRSCYDEGKRIAETLCKDFHSLYGVDTKIVRIFNTYGPNMLPNDGRVISNFICQALRELPLYIYGDGEQTRSFCYITDLIDGIERMVNSELHGPINLGNPEEISVVMLADMVLKMTKSKALLKRKSLPVDDPVKRKPDITEAKEKLGWEPKILLVDGLDKTIRYFRENILSFPYQIENDKL